MKNEIIKEVYNTGYTRYSSETKMYGDVKENFW